MVLIKIVLHSKDSSLFWLQDRIGFMPFLLKLELVTDWSRITAFSTPCRNSTPLFPCPASVPSYLQISFSLYHIGPSSHQPQCLFAHLSGRCLQSNTPIKYKPSLFIGLLALLTAALPRFSHRPSIIPPGN